VGIQSSFQIVGGADVPLGRVGNALNKVDIFHFVGLNRGNLVAAIGEVQAALSAITVAKGKNAELSAQWGAPAVAEAMAGILRCFNENIRFFRSMACHPKFSAQRGAKDGGGGGSRTRVQ
jgi:hypothetical protein